ncbi:MAG: putative quinol monooxygenase [Pseudomonadota bacterium]
MFAVVVTMRVRPGHFEAFMAAITANAATSLAEEPECSRFDVWTDPNRPGEVFLYELYASPAAFDAHLASPHFLAFDAEVAEMLLDKSVATYREQA